MEIDYTGPISPHRQIADWLRGRIRGGELGTGARVTEAEIQQETGVARTTARRAIRVLADEGWLYTVQARGSYVSKDRPK